MLKAGAQLENVFFPCFDRDKDITQMLCIRNGMNEKDKKAITAAR